MWMPKSDAIALGLDEFGSDRSAQDADLLLSLGGHFSLATFRFGESVAQLLVACDAQQRQHLLQKSYISIY